MGSSVIKEKREWKQDSDTQWPFGKVEEEDGISGSNLKGVSSSLPKKVEKFGENCGHLGLLS